MSSENYHRLVEYLTFLVPYFLQIYIKTKILHRVSIQEFLTKNKHSMFHLYKVKECCECETNIDLPKAPRLSKEQFIYLYTIEKSQNQKCQKLKDWPCPCVITANPDPNLQYGDIKLIGCIFEYHLPPDVRNWIHDILEIRNILFHHSESGNVCKKAFEKYWSSLSKSVGSIANAIGPKYKNELQVEEKRIKNEVFAPSNHEEELLTSVYKERNNHLQRQIDSLLQKENKFSSRKSNHEALVEKIDALSFYLKRVAVSVSGNAGITELFDKEPFIGFNLQRIPVLVHMEVPENWNKDDLTQSVVNMRKSFDQSENSNIKIREIHNGELNIILEILSKVMSDPVKLKQELRYLLSAILKGANIDKSVAASVDVRITTDIRLEEDIEENAHEDELSSDLTNKPQTQESSVMSYGKQSNTATAMTDKIIKDCASASLESVDIDKSPTASVDVRLTKNDDICLEEDIEENAHEDELSSDLTNKPQTQESSVMSYGKQSNTATAMTDKTIKDCASASLESVDIDKSPTASVDVRLTKNDDICLVEEIQENAHEDLTNKPETQEASVMSYVKQSNTATAMTDKTIKDRASVILEGLDIDKSLAASVDVRLTKNDDIYLTNKPKTQESSVMSDRKQSNTATAMTDKTIIPVVPTIERGPQAKLISLKLYLLPAGAQVPKFNNYDSLITTVQIRGFGYPVSLCKRYRKKAVFSLYLTTDEFKGAIRSLYWRLMNKDFTLSTVDNKRKLTAVPVQPIFFKEANYKGNVIIQIIGRLDTVHQETVQQQTIQTNTQRESFD